MKSLESCTEEPRLYPEGNEEPLKAVKLDERAEEGEESDCEGTHQRSHLCYSKCGSRASRVDITFKSLVEMQNCTEIF